MNSNEFLKQFVEMRKGMAPPPGQQSVKASDVLPKSKKAKKLGSTKKVTETGLQHIIETKPGRKVVEEYFQDVCNKLTAEKMA